MIRPPESSVRGRGPERPIIKTSEGLPGGKRESILAVMTTRNARVRQGDFEDKSPLDRTKHSSILLSWKWTALSQ
jgi:hypothetical protein